MSTFLEALAQFVQSPTPFERNLIATLLALIVFSIMRFIALRILYRSVKEPISLYHWRRAVTYAIAGLALLVVGRVWFQGFQSISTFLGLLSAGLAIALRDPIVNLAGWLFILWTRPFNVGDRIQIGEHRGDVIDARIFQFSLLEIGNWVDADQSTGRVIHIPNGKIFTLTQANYGQIFQFIWNELPVVITFESNWRKAKESLTEVVDLQALHLSQDAQDKVKQAARKYMISYMRLTPIVYTSVVDSGVVLTIRYLCDARERRESAQAIWEDVLERFAQEDDIEFAYPTVRHYSDPSDGKSGATPVVMPGMQSSS
jgi:small-conductance mechanosensitive channel